MLKWWIRREEKIAPVQTTHLKWETCHHNTAFFEGAFIICAVCLIRLSTYFLQFFFYGYWYINFCGGHKKGHIKNVYLFLLRDRERKREEERVNAQWERGREWEGDRESQAGSRLSVESDSGLKPMNYKIMTCAEIKSQCLTNWATQTPQ